MDTDSANVPLLPMPTAVAPPPLVSCERRHCRLHAAEGVHEHRLSDSGQQAVTLLAGAMERLELQLPGWVCWWWWARAKTRVPGSGNSSSTALHRGLQGLLLKENRGRNNRRRRVRTRTGLRSGRAMSWLWQPAWGRPSRGFLLWPANRPQPLLVSRGRNGAKWTCNGWRASEVKRITGSRSRAKGGRRK